MSTTNDIRLMRVKSRMDEATALQQIVEKTGLKAENLTPDHTEKSWRWRENSGFNFAPDPEQAPVKIFKILRADVEDENMATRQAMEHFDTLENNLQRDHTSDDYVFSKIR